MPLIHFTDRHLVRVLATQSRRTDTSPVALAASHRDLGRFLTGELLECLPLEPCTIAHPQGSRQGWRVANEGSIALVCFMRAGLYVTEGARELLPQAAVFHVSPKRGEGLGAHDLDALGPSKGRTVILLDSVINTGASLEPVLMQLMARGVEHVYVMALVVPAPTAERLAAAYPQVTFLLARTSMNQYVGKGSTDTGNRLFGTLHLAG